MPLIPRRELTLNFHSFKNFQRKFFRVFHAPTSLLKLKRFKAVEDLFKAPPIGGCSHLKGKGPYKDADHEFKKSLGVYTDYNVSDHTFIGGNRVIKCLRCKQEWRPGESGWEEAIRMAEVSTNHASSSEHVLDAAGNVVVTPNSRECIAVVSSLFTVEEPKPVDSPEEALRKVNAHLEAVREMNRKKPMPSIMDVDGPPNENFQILSVPIYTIKRLPETDVEAFLNKLASEGYRLVTIWHDSAVLLNEANIYLRKRGQPIIGKPVQSEDLDGKGIY